MKPNRKGRMIISDLVTSKEMDENSVKPDNWYSCIDGALTKDNYVNSIKEAGFIDVKVLEERPYMELDEDDQEKRQISSISISAVKQ